MPTPERVSHGLRHWFVWFAVAVGYERRLRLVMMPCEEGAP
jgi:hypothetical protein